MFIISLLILLFLLSIFVITPLILLCCGKLFKASNLSFKNAILTGIIILIVGVIFALLSFIFHIESTLINIAFTILSLAITIWIIKKRFSTNILKSVGIYFTYLIFSIIISVVIALSIRTYVVQAFKIPAGSTKPTLLIGDHLLVNKFIYNFKEPSRGDLIVFPWPKDPSKDFIKRIIGIEGDKIEIKNDVLFLNDSEVQLSKIGEYEDEIIFGADEYLETLDGISYHILDISKRNDNFGPIIVPENSLFVLGDNRDNSQDSRYWGFVDKRTVIGKAFIIYWSWDSNKNRVRWDRIGNSL